MNINEILKNRADKIIKMSDADKLQINFISINDALARFANNQITQNVRREDITAIIKQEKNSKISTAYLNRFDEETIKYTFNQLDEMSKFIEEDKEDSFELLPPQDYANTPNVELVEVTPELKIDIISDAVKEVEKHNLNSYGSCLNKTTTMAVANNNGLFASHTNQGINFAITVSADDSSGSARKCSVSHKDIKAKLLAQQAIDKALLSKNPTEIKPGKYTVILEPSALSSIIGFLGFVGFNGLSYEEGRSFASKNMNKKVFSEMFTLVDNPFYENGQGFPFDFEGRPKQNLTLVENGVVKSVVYDSLTAKKYNKKPTGHSMPQGHFDGAIPVNLCLMPGKTNYEDMIKNSDKAILITELHYTNLMNPMNVEITGMTRNGTFLVENGEVAHGIKNMRFTQTLLDAFSNIKWLGNEIEYFDMFFVGGSALPAITIENFNFSSNTEF